VKVRGVITTDREAWEQLYRGYAAFYKVETDAKRLATLWGWLHDADHPVDGLVCEGPDGLIGLAHYRPMPSPLRGGYIGFRDDLFVDPSLRGSGAAAALLDRIAVIARERSWDVVRWITADDNYRARGLYDRIATKTAWNTYELRP